MLNYNEILLRDIRLFIMNKKERVMSEELKPCAHCKGAAKVIYRDNPMSKWKYTAECKDCGAAGSVGSTSKEAEDNWNDRTIEDELKARIKFIEEHNKFYLNQVADLHKMIDDVRHTNKELEKQLTWQDIETAPKDKSYLGIIVHNGKAGSPFTCVYSIFDKEHVCEVMTECFPHKPTHWMPILEFKQKEK